MGAMGKKLRKTRGGIAHWCPACESVHVFAVDDPTPEGARWTFDGNVEAPTFTPSMKVSWGRKAPPFGEFVCHYILTAGVINFCGDCTHGYNGQAVPLPDWPYAPGAYGGIED